MSCVSWSKTQGVAAGASKVWPTESGNRLVRLEITQSLNLSSCAREGNRKSAQRSAQQKRNKSAKKGNKVMTRAGRCKSLEHGDTQPDGNAYARTREPSRGGLKSLEHGDVGNRTVSHADNKPPI